MRALFVVLTLAVLVTAAVAADRYGDWRGCGLSQQDQTVRTGPDAGPPAVGQVVEFRSEAGGVLPHRSYLVEERGGRWFRVSYAGQDVRITETIRNEYRVR